jgi:general secretion pathway protein N
MIRYGMILGLAASFVAFGYVHREALGATPPVAVNLYENTITQGIVDAAPASIGQPSLVARGRPPIGNPLWAVPLRSLSGTRERPIFSPSRRPPPPTVAAAPYVPPAAPPPKPAEPDHPPLTLLGTVVGETEGIGVFVDQSANNVIRLRTGQDYAGWILLSVQGREARFEKDRRTAILALPAPGAEQAGQLPVSPFGGVQAVATWLDGDGQMIRPPPGRSNPIAPPPRTAAQVKADGL